MPERLTRAQARRVALAAQGFAAARPAGPVTARHLQGLIDRVAVLQIDSVNVFCRSHYMPVLSRLGPYDRSLLDRAAARPPRRLVEYWAHEASFVAPATHRLLRFRMARAHDEAWGGMVRAAADKALLDDVRSVVAAQGPLTAARDRARARGERPAGAHRVGLELVAHQARRRVPLLGGRDLQRGPHPAVRAPLRHHLARAPAGGRGRPRPRAGRGAVRELVRLAAAACGVATEPALRDYFRLRPQQSKPAVAELVEAGELLPVAVQGWSRPAYLHAGARLPRWVRARALLSPFDSLVWDRDRTEELFGFRYRLEIYTPAQARVHGYYVLPFLLGDELVARVDLKSDRSPGGGRLLVRAAWAQPSTAPGTPRHVEVAAELAAELAVTARWLGLDGVVVEPRGDLAPALSAAPPA